MSLLGQLSPRCHVPHLRCIFTALTRNLPLHCSSINLHHAPTVRNCIFNAPVIAVESHFRRYLAASLLSSNKRVSTVCDYPMLNEYAAFNACVQQVERISSVRTLPNHGKRKTRKLGIFLKSIEAAVEVTNVVPFRLGETKACPRARM